MIFLGIVIWFLGCEFRKHNSYFLISLFTGILHYVRFGLSRGATMPRRNGFRRALRSRSSTAARIEERLLEERPAMRGLRMRCAP